MKQNTQSQEKQVELIRLMARLLDYPTEELAEHQWEIQSMIADSELPLDVLKGLEGFVAHYFAMPLLDWQAEYDGLFERGRSLSLLIYEHIHGESRDRGQSMVNLLNQYRAAGLDIAVNELPDYLPVFLEFVATQAHEARGWLQDIVPVISLLAVRLEKRESRYSALMLGLLELSDAQVDLDDLREQVAEEKPDHTAKALDKVWEEEAVTFGGDAVNGGCPTNQSRPSEGQRRDQDIPMNWMDASPQPANANTTQGA